VRLAVDLVVVHTIDGQPHVLLDSIEGGDYHDKRVLPSDRVRGEELVAAAAIRSLADQADLVVETIDLFGLGYYDSPARDVRERVVSLAFMVDADRLAEHGQALAVNSVGLAALEWAPLAGLLGDADRGVLLAYDHSKIIFDAANVIASPDQWPPSRTKVIGTSLRDRV
jgi:ADP-ribose pyrophosphatase YjhB (NUDIX family)